MEYALLSYCENSFIFVFPVRPFASINLDRGATVLVMQAMSWISSYMDVDPHVYLIYGVCVETFLHSELVRHSQGYGRSTILYFHMMFESDANIYRHWWLCLNNSPTLSYDIKTTYWQLRWWFNKKCRFDTRLLLCTMDPLFYFFCNSSVILTF